MKKNRRRLDASLIVLTLLACGTLVLSVAALRSHAARVAGSVLTTDLPSLALPASAVASPSSPRPAVSASRQPTPSRSSSQTSAMGTVVVLGDGNSAGDPTATWVGSAAQQLSWSHVVNLSASGRGYVKSPRSCSSTPTPCANFDRSIPAVVAAHPDLVVTFGGAADGDYDLTPIATQYFADLRRALPNATLVAVSPVTTLSPVPYYFTLNTHAISLSAKKSDVVFINVGQPGSGDGTSLSTRAQAAIAAKIVAGLS